MNPTEARVKEFWEKLGFRFIDDIWEQLSFTKRSLDSAIDLPDIVIANPEGKWIKESPPIDLNNLFKWAVPKLLPKYILTIETDLDEYIVTLSDDPLHINAQTNDKDPALALFWAIYKVMEKK